MTAIEFIHKYPEFVEEISKVIKDEYMDIIEELRNIDPHDFIPPHGYFVSDSHAFGFVWKMFIIRCNRKIIWKISNLKFGSFK